MPSDPTPTLFGYSYMDVHSNLLVRLVEGGNGTSSTYVATPGDVRSGAFSDGNLYTFIFLVGSVVLLVLLIVVLVIYFVCHRKTLRLTEEYWKLSQACEEANEALLASNPQKRSNSTVVSRKGSKGPSSAANSMYSNSNSNRHNKNNNKRKDKSNGNTGGGSFYNANGSQYSNNMNNNRGNSFSNPNGSQYKNNNYVGDNSDNWDVMSNNYPNPILPPSQQYVPPPQQYAPPPQQYVPPPQQYVPPPQQYVPPPQQQQPSPQSPSNYVPVSNGGINAGQPTLSTQRTVSSMNNRTSPKSQDKSTSPGQLTRRGSKVSFRLDQNRRME